MKKLFLENDFSTLIKIKPQKKLDRLLKQCRSYHDVKLPEVHPPYSTTFMGIACCNLALAYKLTNDITYFNDLKYYMNTICDYEYWGNAHLVNVDLSASWILFGLSLSYNWVCDDLDELLNDKITKKLIKQSIIMYEYKINNSKGWPTNYLQNHNWINMTGLMMASMVLKDKCEDAQKWYQESYNNFEIVFDLLPEDGSDYEGIVYWRYGVIWLFIYAYLMYTSGIKNYFSESLFLKNTINYRISQAVPNLKESANFGDCHDTHSSHCPALYYLVSKMYDNPYSQYFGDLVIDEFLEEESKESKIKPGILPEAYLEYLWYEDLPKKDFTSLPKVAYFKDLGLISLRSSWNKDAFFMSFKCGAPGGEKQWKKLWDLYYDKSIDGFSLSHQHPDNSSFIIYNKGEFVVIDDGYNRNCCAYDHSVITVDDNIGYYCEYCNDVLKSSAFKLLNNKMFNPVVDYNASISNYNNNQDYLKVCCEYQKYYHPSLKMKKMERTFYYNYQDYVVIFDYLESELNHEYNFTLNLPVDFIINDKTINVETKNQKYQVISLVPSIVTISKKSHNVRAIMTTQEPDKFCETNISKLIIKTNNCNKVLLVNVISFNDELIIEKIDDKFILKTSNNKLIISINGLDFKIKNEKEVI